MDDEQLILLPDLSDFVLPSTWKIEELLSNYLVDDTDHSDLLTDNQSDNISDGIEGFDEAQSQLLSGSDLDSIYSLVALPENNPTNDHSQPTEKNSIKSIAVKSSTINNTANFINGVGLIRTNQSLRLTVPPFPYQHCRYEQELNDIPRYMFVPKNGTITLEIPNLSELREKYGSDVSLWLRITRTTKSYGDLTLRHPYPMWINNKNAKVHDGSLFIPVSNRIIKIENLIMERLKLGALGQIKQFAIHTSTQVDSDGFYPITTNTAKRTRDEYDLRYYHLHFQIFIIDRDLTAYATDLICQTQPIYEYEAIEIKDLPLDVRNVQKHSVKRKQIGQRKKSKAINKKKMAKNYSPC